MTTRQSATRRTTDQATAETVHTVKVDGDLTVQDALNVDEGDLVTLVVTARVRDITRASTAVTTYRLDLTEVNIVDGDDVVSGPSFTDLVLRRAAQLEAECEQLTGHRLYVRSTGPAATDFEVVQGDPTTAPAKATEARTGLRRLIPQRNR